MQQPGPAHVAIPDAPRPEACHQTRRSGLEYAAIALPALAFLCLYSWRPLKLGFYGDDWYIFLHPQPGSLKSLSDLFALFNNRPVSALTSWLAEAMIGQEPAGAQVLNVVLTAATAFSVGWLCYPLAAGVSGSRSARLWGAGVASAAYLAFPWALGFSAWITAAISIAPATILFCVASHLLIGPRGERLSIQLLACLIMAASFLAYEAFYGQFIVILVLAALTRTKKTINWMMARPALLLLAVNVACFLYNGSAGGVRKTFAADWYDTFINGYFNVYFWYAWLHLRISFRDVASIVAVCSIGAIGLGLYLLAARIRITRAALVVLAMLVGIYAAGLLYAMTGYGLATVGVMARTTSVMSVYGALFLGLLGAASAADLGTERLFARMQIAATIALLAAYGVDSSLRLADWVRSWETQSDVLAQFPRVASETEAFDGALLYVGPFGPPTVPTATAPWEISGAVAYALLLQSPEMGARAMAALWSGGGNGPWFADMSRWSARGTANRSRSGCARFPR
jgi:hypothetical protein